MKMVSLEVVGGDNGFMKNGDQHNKVYEILHFLI